MLPARVIGLRCCRHKIRPPCSFDYACDDFTPLCDRRIPSLLRPKQFKKSLSESIPANVRTCSKLVSFLRHPLDPGEKKYISALTDVVSFLRVW